MISFWHLVWIVPVAALIGYIVCDFFAWRDHNEEGLTADELDNIQLAVSLDNGAVIPTRAYISDAGLDLYCRETVTLEPGDSYSFDTGVHVDIPRGLYGKIESKSGLNVKHGIVSLGGVVDAGYTGPIIVKLYNLGKEAYTFTPGSKLAQIVLQLFVPLLPMEVDSIMGGDRGDNGMGSSGY